MNFKYPNKQHKSFNYRGCNMQLTSIKSVEWPYFDLFQPRFHQNGRLHNDFFCAAFDLCWIPQFYVSPVMLLVNTKKGFLQWSGTDDWIIRCDYWRSLPTAASPRVWGPSVAYFVFHVDSTEAQSVSESKSSFNKIQRRIWQTLVNTVSVYHM